MIASKQWLVLVALVGIAGCDLVFPYLGGSSDSNRDGGGALLDGVAPDSDAGGSDDASTDGSRADGPQPDGAQPDGPLPDGPLLDGPRPDGPRPDGPNIDSSPADGPVVDGGSTGPFVAGPQQSIGGTGLDRAYGVAVDPATGRVFVVGEFAGSVDFGDGVVHAPAVADAFVLCFDAAAKPLWARVLASPEGAVARAVAVGAGGEVHVVGSFAGQVACCGGSPQGAAGQRDVFRAIFSNAGALQRIDTFGGTEADHAYGVAVSATGDTAYVTGSFGGTVQLGGTSVKVIGFSDLYVAALTAGGGIGWAYRYGKNGTDAGEGIAVDATGAVWVAGTHWSDLDDVFVARLDGTSGLPSFEQVYGGSGADRAHGIAVDGSGGAVVVGEFNEDLAVGSVQLSTTLTASGEPFVARILASGQTAWARKSDGLVASSRSEVSAVAIGGTKVWLAGAIRGQLKLGQQVVGSPGSDDDVLVATLDLATGAVSAAASFDSGGIDQAHALALSGASAWVVGRVSASIDFGAGALIHRGSSDGFLVQLAP